MTFFLKYSPLLMIITIFNYTMPAERPRSLIDAARYGDITTVQSLIEQKIDLNQQGLKGNTALIFAAWDNRIDIANALIKAGANLNLQQKHGYTALMIAARTNHIAIANALIKAKADLNLQRKEHGYTALMIAAQNNHIAIANALIEAGADESVKDIWGDTALTIAMKCRADQMVSALASEGEKAEYEEAKRHDDTLDELIEDIKARK